MADEKQAPEAAKKKNGKRPQAQKRDLQSKRKQAHNHSYKAKTLTATRALQKALTEKNKESAAANYNLLSSLMDKGVKTGLYKLNKASRIKSRMTKKVKALA